MLVSIMVRRVKAMRPTGREALWLVMGMLGAGCAEPLDESELDQADGVFHREMIRQLSLDTRRRYHLCRI